MVVEQHISEIALATAINSIGGNKFDAALADWLNADLSIDNMTWLAYFQNRKPELLFASSKLPYVHANLEQVYLAGAYLLDPFHDLHIGRAPRGIYRLSEIAPDQFQRNRYFTEYYRNTTMIDEIAFICYPNSGVSIHICLGRDASSNRRFSQRAFSDAQRVAPIVSALVESHWADLKTSGEYEEAETTARLIESVQTERGIRLSNRQAEVAMLILRGHSSASIGLALGISVQTVKVFRKQLYKKCEISSQVELFNLLLPLLGR